MTIRNAERRPSAHKPLVLAAALATASMLVLAACKHDAAPVMPVATATMVPPPAPQPTRAATPAPTPAAAAPSSPADIKGEALYQANCAACHDHSDTTRAPSKVQL